jgi:hypothetical protein
LIFVGRRRAGITSSTAVLNLLSELTHVRVRAMGAEPKDTPHQAI